MVGITEAKALSIITAFISNETNMKTVIELCATKATELMKNNLDELHGSISNMTVTLGKLVTAKQTLDTRVAQLESEMTLNKIHMDLLRRKIDDTEQYTRRPNLVIDGIYLKEHESPSALRKYVVKELTSLGLDVHDKDVDRVHRHEDPYRDNQNYMVQPVIVRFTSWSARNNVYNARRESRFKMRADLTPRRHQILDFARDLVTDKKLASVIDFVAADRNCRLIARTTSGAFHGFSSELEFTGLVDMLLSPESRRKYNKYSDQDYAKFLADQSPAASSPTNAASAPTLAEVVTEHPTASVSDASASDTSSLNATVFSPTKTVPL